jgi:hypothetical protein
MHFDTTTPITSVSSSDADSSSEVETTELTWLGIFRKFETWRDTPSSFATTDTLDLTAETR